MSDIETGTVPADVGFAEIRDESGIPDLDTAEVVRQVRNDPQVKALMEWAADIRGETAGAYPSEYTTWDSPEGWSTPGTGSARKGNLMQRDKYTPSHFLTHQFAKARQAAEEDDNVSTVIDATEGFAFSKMKMGADDKDQENIWNQIAKGIDIDTRMREFWRDQFIYSQFICGVWWTQKDFKIKGKSDKGVARKKTVNLNVPTDFTLFDSMKVMPAGSLMFNQERLVYLADPVEDPMIDQVLKGSKEDAAILNFMVERYVPTDGDIKQLSRAGWDRMQGDRMWLLNPETVFRHTATRPQYQAWAPVRMKAIFPWLDMKAQLMSKDRAYLIGGTNFILLIKKGSDSQPGTPREVANLHNTVRTLAQVPVLIGDHRLSVEIITPDTETVLKPESYNAIDARITSALYKMFSTGNYAAGAKSDDSIKLAKIVAISLENQRNQMKRTLERQVWQRVVDRNPDFFDEVADLQFQPKHIALDFDAGLYQFYLEIRDRREMSRESFLTELDLDQDQEADRLQYEKVHYDKIFETAVPFSSPALSALSIRPTDPKAPAAAGGSAPSAAPAKKAAATPAPAGTATQKSGGRNGGGTRNGGGKDTTPGSRQGKAKGQS